MLKQNKKNLSKKEYQTTSKKGEIIIAELINKMRM